MTTFTITCPPTVAGTSSRGTVSKTYAFTGTELINNGALQGSSGNQTTESFTTRITDVSSNLYISNVNYESINAFGPECGDDVFGTYEQRVDVTSVSFVETSMWSGAKTVHEGLTYNDCEPTVTGTTFIWTSFADTSSQTTTTQTNTVYQTTFRDTTNVTTRSGTTIQTGTMTAPEPRTTITQTEGFTTKTANLATTRITTTTQQDSLAKWRTGAGGATHRGTFQSATVVCLETSNLGNLRPELAWVVSSRPDFTATSTAAVQQQVTTQFTVFPSFVPTAGHVEQATYDTDAEQFTFSTSSEVIETPTTYRTTTQTANTITVASRFTSLPSPLSQQFGTTTSTQNWFSTIRESLFTGGDTTTTTIFSTTTHEGRIGNVTWNATHHRSTTALTSFGLSTAYTYTSSSQGIDGNNGDSFTRGYSETKTITFSRPVSILAATHAPTASQNQCGSSLSFAVAAASNATSAAQQIGAEGISMGIPSFLNLTQVARTARAPLGVWFDVTGGTTITASAGPSGLSVTSRYGPTNAITTTSSEGAWTLAGAAVSRANLPLGQRINLGGSPPTGTATAFYDAGIFSTSDSNGSGTLEVNEARTEQINSNAARTAYLPATGVFISGGQRYNTTARNITQIIPEEAIITNRNQLIV